MSAGALPYLDAAAVARRRTPAQAADALESALQAGLDPEREPLRTALDLGDGGQLLVMPSAAARHAAVKLVTIGGAPRIQGLCVVFDPDTLTPAALIDGIALTNLRTAAVSTLAVRHLADPGARRLVVFGRGPQAHAHAEALAAEHALDDVVLLGRDDPRAPDLVARADVICCATTARSPLFDGARVAAHATVVAIGSHEPGARETDDALARRATVVVESRASALAEAGDVIGALASGAIASADELVTLAALARGDAFHDPDRPRLFKSTGMAWEDAVVASALLDASA